jgi:hypothetical protein
LCLIALDQESSDPVPGFSSFSKERRGYGDAKHDPLTRQYAAKNQSDRT